VVLLGMSAVCQRLGIHNSTLRRLCERGQVKYLRDSAGRRLFLREDVEALARKRDAKPFVWQPRREAS
jgi:excisionase family DNA binding protein